MDFFKVVMVVWVVWGGVIYILPSASVIGFQLWGCGGRVSREVTNKDPQLPSFQPRSQSSDAVQPLAPVTHHCPKRRHWSQSEPELVTQACLCDLSSAGGLCTVPHPHPLTPPPSNSAASQLSGMLSAPPATTLPVFLMHHPLRRLLNPVQPQTVSDYPGTLRSPTSPCGLFRLSHINTSTESWRATTTDYEWMKDACKQMNIQQTDFKPFNIHP